MDLISRHVRRQALGEFTQNIPTDSSGEAHGGVGEDQARSAIRAGIVEIGRCRRGQVAEEIGIVWRSEPTIGARKKMQSPPRAPGATLEGSAQSRSGALIRTARSREDGPFLNRPFRCRDKSRCEAQPLWAWCGSRGGKQAHRSRNQTTSAFADATLIAD